MSDGLNLQFNSLVKSRSNAAPLASLIAKADFGVPVATGAKSLSMSLPECSEIGPPTANWVEQALDCLLLQTGTLEFHKSPREYFVLSVFPGIGSSAQASFSTETRLQHANTIEQLEKAGAGFLEFLVALQEFFSAQSFADQEAGECSDLERGIFQVGSPPFVAFGVHSSVSDAMLKMCGWDIKCWDTRVGKLYCPLEYSHSG
jgi:hypothetical protein